MSTHPYTLVASCAVVAFAFLATNARADEPMPGPDPLRVHVQQLDPQHLKRVYLACSHEATQRILQTTEAAGCSVVHDVLLHRDFKGDFDAMVAWYQAAKAAPPVAAAPQQQRVR
jgi:hypothetical protein